MSDSDEEKKSSKFSSISRQSRSSRRLRESRSPSPDRDAFAPLSPPPTPAPTTSFFTTKNIVIGVTILVALLVILVMTKNFSKKPNLPSMPSMSSLSSPSTKDEAPREFARLCYNQARSWLTAGDEALSSTQKAIAYTRGLAFLNAARLHLNDDRLEEILREDVSQLVKTLEEKQTSSIETIDPGASSYAAVFVIR